MQLVEVTTRWHEGSSQQTQEDRGWRQAAETTGGS